MTDGDTDDRRDDDDDRNQSKDEKHEDSHHRFHADVVRAKPVEVCFVYSLFMVRWLGCCEFSSCISCSETSCNVDSESLVVTPRCEVLFPTCFTCVSKRRGTI